ncbi:MAG: hypothetical protein N2578_07745, partial [Bdellovibrionaceae bacterium]|nr:hypothetical protein [Pseudobdellovibrionaceae bacterium]
SLLSPTGYSLDDLPPGRYRLQAALADIFIQDWNHVQPEQIYAYTEKEVEIHAPGVLSQEIDFEVRNLKSLANTTQVLLQLMPLDETSTKWVETRVFGGPILFQSMGWSAPLSLIKGISNLRDLGEVFLHSQGHRLESIEVKRAKFLKQHQFDYVAVEQSRGQNEWLIGFFHPLAYFVESMLKSPLTPSILNQAMQARAVYFERLRGKAGGDTDWNWVAEALSKWSFKRDLSAKEQENLAIALCKYWFGEQDLQRIQSLGTPVFQVPVGQRFTEVIQMCRKEVRKSGLAGLFDIQPIHFVNGVKFIGLDHSYVRDILAGQTISVSRSESDTWTQSVSWDMSVGLKLPESLGFKFLNASTGVRYSVAHSQSTTQSRSAAENIAAGVALTQDVLWVRLQAQESQACIGIKLNPEIFLPTNTWYWGRGASYWTGLLHPHLSSDKKLALIQRGILFCEPIKKHPVTFQEVYSVFNQRMSLGNLVDVAAERSRPFFTVVRGLSDQRKFVLSVVNMAQLPEDLKHSLGSRDWKDVNLQTIFLQGVPSFPGMTQSPLR